MFFWGFIADFGCFLHVFLGFIADLGWFLHVFLGVHC